MRDELIHTVEGYFAAVDRKDVEATLAFFTPDASFTIATYAQENVGRDTQIRAMFERLFARYERVWHGNFEHIVQSPDAVASRFDVQNWTPDGQTHRKHNSNFFFLRDGKFSRVFVYMSGDNSLN